MAGALAVGLSSSVLMVSSSLVGAAAVVIEVAGSTVEANPTMAMSTSARTKCFVQVK